MAPDENGIPSETVTLKILVGGIDVETYIINKFYPVFDRTTAVVDESVEWDASLTLALENLNNLKKYYTNMDLAHYIIFQNFLTIQ